MEESKKFLLYKKLFLVRLNFMVHSMARYHFKFLQKLQCKWEA